MRLALLVLLGACSAPPLQAITSAWQGQKKCAGGKLVARGASITLTQPATLVLEGSCRLVIEDSTLVNVAITARASAVIEIRRSKLAGTITMSGRAQATLEQVVPAGDADFTTYADDDSHYTITRSHLRGDRPTGGNGNGFVDVLDSKLEARGGATAIYLWGNAKVRVRGGTMIGEAMAQDRGGTLDLEPTKWSTPRFDMQRARSALYCLATADLRLRAGIDAVRGGSAVMLEPNHVRECVDGTVANASHTAGPMIPRHPPDPTDAPALAWGAKALPFAGVSQQLRDYLAAGDDKDDGGARGSSLRAQAAVLAADLEQASAAYATLVLAHRDATYAWYRGQLTHELDKQVSELRLGAQDACLAYGERPLDREHVLTQLDRASDAATRLYDLVASRPTIADQVKTFWAEESGNATTWGALDAALRALRDDVKRLRRDMKDRAAPPSISDGLLIAARLEEVESHYSRLVFR